MKTNSRPKSRPNVIYILSDDQRADHLQCAGHPLLQTPHLDQLASDGVRFTHAFCTSPLCTPSRACHYTGQWERRHGINFNSNSSMAPEAWEQTFPMQLKKNGWFVGWIGKNHVPAGPGGYRSGYIESTFDYWYGNHGHVGFYPKALHSDMYQNAAADTQAEVFSEAVMDFLQPNPAFRSNLNQPLPERPQNQPFCLCLTFNLPHDSSTGSMELRPEDGELYTSAYRDRQHLLQPPSTYKYWRQAVENPRLPRSLYNGSFFPCYDYVKTPNALRERQVRTCQTITGMDRVVGKLREQLEKQGLAENTIIVFSTDHGLHHGEHGLAGKAFLYEPDIRIPLIIYDPRQREKSMPRVRDEMVVVPDLAPTVMELCGLEAPSSMQGTSLAPLLAGEAPAWREAVFTEQLMDIQNYPRSESVRTRDWKYIRYFARTEDPAQVDLLYRGTLDDYGRCLDSTLDGEEPVYEELFHLSEDPEEIANLAGDPDCRDKCNMLREELLELGRSVHCKVPMTMPL